MLLSNGMLYSVGDLYPLGFESGLRGIPPISGKYSRDSCLTYSNPAANAMRPVPTDPIRNINRIRVDVSDDEGVDSTDVAVILTFVTTYEES